LKLTLGERESEVSQLRDEFDQMKMTNSEQQALITKLEDDLSKGSSSGPLEMFQSNTQSLQRSSNTSHPLSGSADMFEIVCGQRDRFKTRLTEVERENELLAKQLESLRNELLVFRTDNVKLYEKIRYLQSYGDISSKRGVLSDAERQATFHEDELEGKYGQMYEDNINPFTIFNRKERYKRYRDLNTAERVILNGSRFFLSNKSSRLFLFFYSVALHILVMASLYKLAHTSTSTLSSPSL